MAFIDKMGCRAVGFVELSEQHKNPSAITNTLKERLIELGAFGFESWWMRVQNMQKKNVQENNTSWITFSDAPDNVIAVNNGIVLAGDSSLEDILGRFELIPSKLFLNVEGLMAKIGDFKIRYGIATYQDKQIGVIYEVEYLPIRLINSCNNELFYSMKQLLNLNMSKLYTYDSQAETEFDYYCLGELYSKLLEERSIK